MCSDMNMIVTEVVYVPEEQAAAVSDFIRLKMWLEKGGVDQKSDTFEGDSKYMKDKAWLMMAEFERVEADTLRVEAFNLEVPVHTLLVNGRRFEIPLTGANLTQTFRFGL